MVPMVILVVSHYLIFRVYPKIHQINKIYVQYLVKCLVMVTQRSPYPYPGSALVALLVALLVSLLVALWHQVVT